MFVTDLLPKAILRPVGYVDDIVLAAYVLNNLVNKMYEENFVKYCVGDEDVWNVIQRILDIANTMVRSGIWSKLKKDFYKNKLEIVFIITVKQKYKVTLWKLDILKICTSWD